MIRKAIDILKMRWPEVMLIVVLQAAMMVFADDYMQTYQAMSPEKMKQEPLWGNFFVGVGLIVYMVIILKLYLGFLKSAATSGQTPQEPKELLRIGRPYFIRMLIFQLLLEVSVSVLVIPIIAYLGGVIWKVQDVSKIPNWFVQLISLLGMLALMKPLFLIPARILVYEDTVFQAFSAVWHYKLARIDHFMPWTLGCFGAVAGVTLINSLAAVKTPLYYVLSGVHFVFLNLVLLGLTLVVVLWLQQQFETQQAHAAERSVQE